MPLTVAMLEADFDRFDGLEPVTYRRYDEGGSLTNTVNIAKALRRDTMEMVVVNDQFIATDEKVAWHVKASSVTGLVPRKGDTITGADGIVWIVWLVQRQTLGARFRLTCVRR